MKAVLRRSGVSFALVLLCMVVLVPAAYTAPPDFENLSRIKAALRDYVRSGTYAKEIAAVAREAEAYLAARVAKADAQGPGKLAVVLDIDDTALSTWPNLSANDFGFIKQGPCNLPRGPCGWPAWQALGEAPVIEPILALSRRARGLGLAVFFISGRHERYRDATERNLRAAGYADWSGLILNTTTRPHHSPMEAFKAPARQKLIEQGYVIVLNMGDQESDLVGGYAERTFKVPNPFYIIP